ncbi:MAG: hypothetical protein ACREE7_12995, partial [Dongiaceae bacterium]
MPPIVLVLGGRVYPARLPDWGVEECRIPGVEHAAKAQAEDQRRALSDRPVGQAAAADLCVSRETFLRKRPPPEFVSPCSQSYIRRPRPNPEDRIVNVSRLLKSLGLEAAKLKAGDLIVRSPIDGGEIARLKSHTPAQVSAAIAKAHGAF